MDVILIILAILLCAAFLTFAVKISVWLFKVFFAIAGVVLVWIIIAVIIGILI